MRRILLGALFILLTLSAVKYYQTQKPLLDPPELPKGKPMYEGAGRLQTKVSLFSEKIPQITQIEITPDAKYMLVGTLPGTVYVYHKIDGQFRRQTQPFFIVKTSHPGFPPREAGLTGIILGADFKESGDVFFTYSFAEDKKKLKNRVTRVTFTKQLPFFGGKEPKVIGQKPVLIFEANELGGPSHQIQDGVGVLVGKNPHALFTVGEGFKAKKALDEKLESGKVILIQRDGSVTSGVRPYLHSKKVQAIGIRNAPAVAYNPKVDKVAIADTGPNNYDRFLYGTLFEHNGVNVEKLSFNWDGTEESLFLPALDLYDTNKEDMVLHRWSPTETAGNIAFYNNPNLPKLEENQQYVLVTLFGKTSYKSNKPGKKIILGTLTHGIQDTITFEDLIIRTPDGEGKLGHPIGLAIDPQNNNIYFGDIMDGRIYRAIIQ